jgi:hypothetical protein
MAQIRSDLDFDELNKLVGYKRSLPIEQYFGEMGISTKQKRRRIAMASDLEDEIVYVLAFLFENREKISEYAIAEFENAIKRVFARHNVYVSANSSQNSAENEDELVKQTVSYGNAVAHKIATELADSTFRHQNEMYFFSKDRARYIAEEETNSAWNEADFAEEKENGSKFKTWATIGDNKVRESHREVDGLTIPIDQPFELEGGLMMYPRDDSLGASDEEINGCRCWLEFS